MRSYGRALGDLNVDTVLSAQVDTELNGSVGIGATVAVDAVEEVVLERRNLAEAEIHVGLLTVQGGVVSDDLGEAVDLC